MPAPMKMPKGMSENQIRMMLVHRRATLTRKVTTIKSEMRRLASELESTQAELATVEDGERLLNEGA